MKKPAADATRVFQTKRPAPGGEAEKAGTVAVSAFPVKRNNPLTTAVNGLRKVETNGIEPSTPSLQSNRQSDASSEGKRLTPTPSPVCTRVCTSEPENDNAGTADGGRDEGEGTDQGDRLDKLAAALLTLSQADRERLAAMLTRQ